MPAPAERVVRIDRRGPVLVGEGDDSGTSLLHELGERDCCPRGPVAR